MAPRQRYHALEDLSGAPAWGVRLVADTERAQRLREIVIQLEALRPNCARRLLRQQGLHDALRQAEQRAEAILQPDSTAFRLFDRMRRERNVWWQVHDVYVEPDDSAHLDTWIEILTTAVKELDPDVGIPEELNADLIREVDSLKNLMIACIP